MAHFIIYFIIILTIIFIYSSKTLWKLDSLDYIFLSLISAFLAFILFFITLEIGSSSPKFEYKKSEIVSLSDNSNTNSSFFLGIGGSDESHNFTFYKKQPDGYVLENISAKNAKIIYIDDNQNPYIKEITSCTSNISYLLCNTRFTNGKHEIYVPRGTIKSEFVLDSE